MASSRSCATNSARRYRRASWPNAGSHTPGTPDDQAQHATDQGRTLINGHGQRVASDPNLISYLRDLEAFVRSHPSIAFARDLRLGAQERADSLGLTEALEYELLALLMRPGG